ncbi:hypothetical protein GCM10022267_03850 [Lentzea roselyniae]|uniref:Uncharacterized protein n=1 Tax=Lentzea roselyniae TaxID=531940 RepID=A0ABP7A0X8_9PSEU
MVTSGEALHEKGRDGARRAKRWLEATTRVKMAWLNTDPIIGDRCEFQWPHGRQFSFDIVGFLSGGPVEGQSFLAEVKNYSTPGNQPVEYPEYLAKCYVTYAQQPKYSDNFMWITWHPFKQTEWTSLCSAEMVRRCVIGEHKRVFGVGSPEEAESLVDMDIVNAVAERLWVIVLSDKQEKLVISLDHLAVIRAYEVREGEAS